MTESIAWDLIVEACGFRSAGVGMEFGDSSPHISVAGTRSLSSLSSPERRDLHERERSHAHRSVDLLLLLAPHASNRGFVLLHPPT